MQKLVLVRVWCKRPQNGRKTLRMCFLNMETLDDERRKPNAYFIHITLKNLYGTKRASSSGCKWFF